jgi:hypothetical protein
MLELGKNPECPCALNARDTTILVYPSGRKPWERLNGSHIRLEQGSLQKVEKALYKVVAIAKGGRQSGGFFSAVSDSTFFPEKWIQATSRR